MIVDVKIYDGAAQLQTHKVPTLELRATVRDQTIDLDGELVNGRTLIGNIFDS